MLLPFGRMAWQMAENPYTADFFKTGALLQSYASAQHIARLVLEIVPAHSVLDIGCGRGDFLRAFAEAGITDIMGLDGDYVPRDALVIDPRAFRVADLGRGFDLQRRYDLVLSLEVAEHLPPASAELFVRSLVRHGSVVLFSAAVPHQGGTGHLNEQWPSYWAAHFDRLGYKPYDVIRPLIWRDERVAWWYRQNTLLFATEAAASALPRLAAASPSSLGVLDRVHPQLYLAQSEGLRRAQTQMSKLQTFLRQASSFEVEHLADGKINIKPVRDTGKTGRA